MKKTHPKEGKRISWWFSLQLAILSSPESNAYKSYDEIVKNCEGLSKNAMNEKPLWVACGWKDLFLYQLAWRQTSEAGYLLNECRKKNVHFSLSIGCLLQSTKLLVGTNFERHLSSDISGNHSKKRWSNVSNILLLVVSHGQCPLCGALVVDRMGGAGKTTNQRWKGLRFQLAKKAAPPVKMLQDWLETLMEIPIPFGP